MYDEVLDDAQLEWDELQAQLARAQQQLADLKLANSAVTEGIWLLHLVNGDAANASNSMRWSKQYRKLLGYNHIQDFPDGWDSWLNAMHADDMDVTVAAYNKHITDKSGNTPYLVEYRLMTADRGYVWFRERCATMRNEYGQALVSAGAIRDISDEHASKELHQLNLQHTEQNMHKISEIAETVNQVAMQLTILAMNATIEAARAGQAGRGFAVVANEVSRLAAHTTKAMNEIRKMAEQS
jgi:Methyl-accepting chemotaxis protein (MCP) signalling domain/PAS fold